MDTLPSSNFLFFFLLSFIFLLCSSGSFLSDLNDIRHKPPKRANPHRRELIQTAQHDFMNPPFTTYPTTPLTNPATTPPFTAYPTTPLTNPVTTPATGATTPPDTSTPPIITATPIPPATDPLNPPVPVTNPVTTPSTTFPPVTTYPSTPTVNAPAVPGQSWCVARGGLPETVTQVALDYACGIGGADCSAIQQGQSCYNPNSLQNHASYAFNSYFQRNPVQASCDFGGTAMITNVNPSSGSCIFTAWSSSSSSSASPATVSPTTTTPMPTPTTYPSSSGSATPVGSGTPPTVMNATNPALGGGITGFGEIPPTTATTSPATVSSSFKPFISCCITVAVSIIIGSSYLTHI